MNITITNSFNSITENDVIAFEAKIGIDLPLEYRQFLLTYNGGVPALIVFPIKENKRDTRSMLQILFGLKQEGVNSLEHRVDEIGERFPIDLLPIGNDLGGNIICISIRGVNRGKIFFWELETEKEDEGPPDYSNVYPVTDSFNEFLNSLTAPNW
jgi:hypothetical protein